MQNVGKYLHTESVYVSKTCFEMAVATEGRGNFREISKRSRKAEYEEEEHFEGNTIALSYK